MTYLEQAIRDSVENGGYEGIRLSDYDANGLPGNANDLIRGGLERYALIDPLFFQALGKARGWFAQVMRKCPVKDCIECTFTEEETYCRKHGHLMVLTAYVHKSEEWLKNWHRLIDHLAAGKDIESFFEELK